MKKLSIICICIVLGAITSSCETENIEENVLLDQQVEKRSNIDPSCYTFEVIFNKNFFQTTPEKIHLKATMFFDGFGPGLYLGSYTINEFRTVRIEIPERYRNSYQLSPNDRFKFEIDKISPDGNRFYQDQLFVGQLGNRKNYFNMGFPHAVNGPFIIPYTGFQIRECE